MQRLQLRSSVAGFIPVTNHRASTFREYDTAAGVFLADSGTAGGEREVKQG